VSKLIRDFGFGLPKMTEEMEAIYYVKKNALSISDEEKK